jgi:hypothetical protein
MGISLIRSKIFGILLTFSIFPLLVFWISLPASAFAFHNDSAYHAPTTRNLRWTCDDGRFLWDPPDSFIHGITLRKRACSDDEAMTDRRGYLYKNERRVSRWRVLDFKLSRNGKIYYRLKRDRKLYSEQGLLNSGPTRVLRYWVSASDNVVYINEDGEIFKDGNLLWAGAGKILRWSVTVSVNGNAIYLNRDRDIFFDGKKLNRSTSKVSNFAVDINSNVFFVDRSGRLFRNNQDLYTGPDRVQSIALGPRGAIAFLTSARRDNLHFQGFRYSAGNERVIDFEFNRRGELIYLDAVGRRWNNGLLVFD